MQNTEIRQALDKKRLRHYELAQALGVHPQTLSHWLAVEMPDAKKKKILEIIKTFHY